MDKTVGYIEVEIGGRVRPLKFGMGAWRFVSEVTGLPMNKFDEIDPLILPVYLIYGGAKHAALCQNEPVDFNAHDVFDWVDSMPQQTLSDIMQCVMTSKLLGNTFNALSAKKK